MALFKMFISVVVPAHNEEKYIRNCLDSLWNQSLDRSRYEIIVVDNACTDRTPYIAEGMGARVIHQPQKGVAIARQTGFMAAEGEIIASSDADSVVAPDWLEVISDFFLNNPEFIGITGSIRLLGGKKLDQIVARYGSSAFLKVNIALGKSHFAGVNFAVTKGAFLKVGGFDLSQKSAEDFILSLKLKGIGKIAFCPEMITYTSARRIEKRGRIEFIKHTLNNYIRVGWLRKSALEFKDIR